MPNASRWVFVSKELRDLKASPQVWPGYLILPLLGVIIPSLFLALSPLDPTAAIDPDIASLMRFAARDPDVAGYPVAQQLPRLIVRDFGAFFLLVPVMLSAMGAALAIAGEKQQRTLEPILATPISDRDLVIAKLAAAMMPAVAVTWLAAGLFAVVVTIVTMLRFGTVIGPGLPFLVSVALVAPAGGAVAGLLGMRVSIRAKDVQGAVQSASLWVIPAAIALIATIGRVAVRSVPAAMLGAIAAGLLAWWLFRGTLKRFEREEILTRWG